MGESNRDKIDMALECNHKGEWCKSINRTCQEGYCSECCVGNTEKQENSITAQEWEVITAWLLEDQWLKGH